MTGYTLLRRHGTDDCDEQRAGVVEFAYSVVSQELPSPLLPCAYTEYVSIISFQNLFLKVLPRKRTLHRPESVHKSAIIQSPHSIVKNSPLRTILSQRRTPTPHITHLRHRTRLTRTIRTQHRPLPLIPIKHLHQRAIPLHRLGNPMPKRRIQRIALRPPRRLPIHVSRAVLETEHRPRLIKR
jgi:hypothetical protein